MCVCACVCMFEVSASADSYQREKFMEALVILVQENVLASFSEKWLQDKIWVDAWERG